MTSKEDLKALFDNIEKDLDELIKLKRAISLIKFKRVDVNFEVIMQDTYDEYLKLLGRSSMDWILNEDEWKFLKELFGDYE